MEALPIKNIDDLIPGNLYNFRNIASHYGNFFTKENNAWLPVYNNYILLFLGVEFIGKDYVVYFLYENNIIYFTKNKKHFHNFQFEELN